MHKTLVDTLILARYEHVNKQFSTWTNFSELGQLSTEEVAVAQHGHTPLFGSDLNSVELLTFWFCLECHTHTAQVKLAGQTEFIQQWLLKVGLSLSYCLSASCLACLCCVSSLAVS